MTTEDISIKEVTITRQQEIFLSWSLDILIYLLVFNLFVEYNSKFVIDLIFGDHVELGKFLDVIILVISLMVAREIFQRIYSALGEREPATT
jgi:hypothetical protein